MVYRKLQKNLELFLNLLPTRVKKVHNSAKDLVVLADSFDTELIFRILKLKLMRMKISILIFDYRFQFQALEALVQHLK